MVKKKSTLIQILLLDVWTATNYNPDATEDDGSCEDPETCSSGQHLVNGECVNICTAEQVWNEDLEECEDDTETCETDCDNGNGDGDPTDQEICEAQEGFSWDEDILTCVEDKDPVLGCTDPDATNYDEDATEDDGSCESDEDPAPRPRRSGGSSGSIARVPVAPQGQVLGATATCGISIEHYLRKGYNNDRQSVITMQEFLAEHLSAPLTADGSFGPATEHAVKQFQSMYANDVLAPWGINQPTGIAYLTTIYKINTLLCPDGDIQAPTALVPFSKHPNTPKK